MNHFLSPGPEAKCPKCRRRPAIRINDAERERYAEEQPDHIVLTYHCRCGEVYPVRAKDYQGAA